MGLISGQFGIPKIDKDFRLWVTKETWLEHLLDMAIRVLQECLALRPLHIEGVESLEDYFTDFKPQYRKKMFMTIEPDMEISKGAKEQPNIRDSAKRVVWR